MFMLDRLKYSNVGGGVNVFGVSLSVYLYPFDWRRRWQYVFPGLLMTSFGPFYVSVTW